MEGGGWRGVINRGSVDELGHLRVAESAAIGFFQLLRLIYSMNIL